MRRSLARTQESAIDPGSSGIRWFKLTETLAEHGSAEANPCRWSPTTSRWTPATDAAKIRVYSTAQGVTGEANAFVACYYAPWARRYEVIATTQPSASIVRFKLTEKLYTGDAAEAVLRVCTDGVNYTDGDAIMVVDWWGQTPHAPGGIRGMFQAAAGMEGWAFAREVSGIEGNPLPEYDIVWMECYAWTISFELQENMGGSTPGQASANVIDSWEQGVAPPATVTILDDENLFPRALSGAKGIAIRDEHVDLFEPDAPAYRIVSCQQMSKHAYALLAEDMSATGDFDITDFIVTDFSPFNQTPNPVPTTANNLHGLHGETDDQVTLEWDEQLEKWVIQQVDYRAQTGETYRTALGRINASTALDPTDLSTNPGNIIPATGTATDSTVPLSSVTNCAVYWPHINGSSQVVISRNLTANKTFYNATPFRFDAGELVWVEEMPLQSGSGTSRDVDTSLGKIWLVRGYHRKTPYALLTASSWESDGKIAWSINQQVGGLVSLADSNKNVVLDCPVYQYPFEFTISGNVCAEVDESATDHQNFTIATGGTLTMNGSATTRVVQGWRVNQGNNPFTTNGPTPDVTGAASAGTAHTHSLSAHTHTVDAADMALTVRPDNRDTAFSVNPGTTIPVSIKGVGTVTEAQTFNLTVSATSGSITTRYSPSTGVGTLALLIKPLFSG